MRRTLYLWLALLMVVVSIPKGAHGQEVPALTNPTFPLPLYHDGPEKGFYSVNGFLYYHQTKALPVAKIKEIELVLARLKSVMFPVVW